MQITPEEIAETLAMVSKQHLDIRTITLGLNLRGCTHEDVNVMARKVYDRMTTAAEKLVPTAEQLEREYGIPIVNKRISVTPIAEICAATQATDLSPIAIAMDKAGKEVGVDFVGGFSALVHKGASRADNNLMESIPAALAATDNVCASVNVGSTRAGINMDAAFKMAGIIKQAAEATKDKQCIGAGKLVVFCNAVDEGVYLLREIVDTLLCLIAAKTTLKAEGLGDNADGKGTDFLASDFCNYRSCTGTSAAAFTCGNENHVGIGKSFANLGTGFLCCLTANLGVGTRTQTTGNFFADMDSLIGIGKKKGLTVSINGDEFNAFDAGFNHAVYGIRAAAANADNFDNRKIIVAKNLLHYVLAFDFISALLHKDRKPQETLGLFYTMAC